MLIDTIWIGQKATEQNMPIGIFGTKKMTQTRLTPTKQKSSSTKNQIEVEIPR